MLVIHDGYWQCVNENRSLLSSQPGWSQWQEGLLAPGIRELGSHPCCVFEAMSRIFKKKKFKKCNFIYVLHADAIEPSFDLK